MVELCDFDMRRLRKKNTYLLTYSLSVFWVWTQMGQGTMH